MKPGSADLTLHHSRILRWLLESMIKHVIVALLYVLTVIPLLASEEDRVKWNKRYGIEGYLFGRTPSHFLAENINTFPKGRALDLAAGEGRNAVFLARHGYQVDAVDISDVALEKARRLAHEKGVKINTIQADLDHYKIEKETYDVIANFNFLNRKLIPQIKEGLKKGGVVIFESYTMEQKDIPWGPKDPRYLLNPNELLELFKDLRILFYKEGIFDVNGRKKASAYLIAKKE